jgi:hypothetical protein
MLHFRFFYHVLSFEFCMVSFVLEYDLNSNVNLVEICFRIGLPVCYIYIYIYIYIYREREREIVY